MGTPGAYDCALEQGWRPPRSPSISLDLESSVAHREGAALDHEGVRIGRRGRKVGCVSRPRLAADALRLGGLSERIAPVHPSSEGLPNIQCCSV